MADTNTIQLADIIAPNTPPPAPPPYGWIALGASLTLIVALFVARLWWRSTRNKRAALALLKQAEHALQQQKLDPRAAAFQSAQALRLAYGKSTLGDNTQAWSTLLSSLDQARYAPQPPSAQDAAHLLVQARHWVKAC